MNGLSSYLQVPPEIFILLVIDLAIAVALLTALRWLGGIIAAVNPQQELAQKDNFAFGISLAGLIAGVAILMTGVISGESEQFLSPLTEAGQVLGYGVLGIVLLKLGRIVQDKIAMPAINISKQILAGNRAAALVEVANSLAIGLIVRASMQWVESASWLGVAMVFSAFVFSQILLTLVTRYRSMVYAKRHAGKQLQHAFEQGNQALSIRYLGHVVGVALAVTAASRFVFYDPYHVWLSLGLWMLIALILSVLLSLLSVIARLAILSGVNVVEEVDQQQNVGVASVEASIYVAMGLLLMALMA